MLYSLTYQQAFDSESSEFSKLQSKIGGLSEIDAQERSSEEDKFRS